MNRAQAPIFETPRLILRPVKLTDEEAVQEQFPYMNILRYMTTAIPWPYPDDGARQFLQAALAAMREKKEYTWAITCKAESDDRLIGIIGLHPRGEDHRGFWLSERFHGRGLMKEAILPVTDFAFGKLGMPALVLFNAEPNLASHRIKLLSGATNTGVEENVPYIGGKFRRVRWLLTREQWEQHRDAFLAAHEKS